MLNSRDLKDLRADVRANCEIFIEDCRKAGLFVLVTQTLRDDEYQATLFQKGYAKTAKTTFHGRGLAFDICKNVRGHEYDDAAFFKKCGEIGKRIGFSWGGDWKSFPDRPHFQWDDGGKYSGAQVRAGKLPRTMPAYSAGPDYRAQLKKRAGLEDKTLDYLEAYKYGGELLKKLATMK